MAKNGCDGEYENVSYENQEEEEEVEEESLSLRDLPNKEEEPPSSPRRSCEYDHQDFDFLLKESEMCDADDVFFQGQILPLSKISRNNSHSHSVSSGTSSRSSSIRSHNSFTSSGTSSSSTTTSKTSTTTISSSHNHNYKRNTNTRSQLSQNSPLHIRPPKVSNTNNDFNRKSSLWSLFRIGLIPTPELKDLGVRRNGSYRSFHSRNSSSSSVKSNSSNSNSNRNRVSDSKQRISNKNRILLGACSCSVDDVETAPPRTSKIWRNSSVDKGKEVKKKDDDEEEEATVKVTQATVGKQAMSRLRTFEWLKQLSLEGLTVTL